MPDQPEGRINLVRHLTPEALWQERFLRHANNATALEEVVLCVAEPADTAARFSRLTGCAVIPDPAGGLALAFARGRVRLLPPNADVPTVPCIAGLTVRTSDGNAAIGRLLREHAFPYRSTDTGLTVNAIAAGGVAVRFAPGA